MTESFSLHNLDIKMLEYLNFKHGTFIECGANDGISQSNTYLYEKNFEWSGLLVEPNKTKFEQCVENRKKSKVENYALVGKNFDKKYIRGNFSETDPSESLMSMVVDEGDWQNENISQNRKLKETNHQIIEVPTTTISNLLHKHNIKKIDFFSLDVEGYEISVLNGLDFSIHRPKYFLIETSNDIKIQNEIRSYMNLKNYKFIKPLSLNDDLFVDNQIIIS